MRVTVLFIKHLSKTCWLCSISQTIEKYAIYSRLRVKSQVHIFTGEYYAGTVEKLFPMHVNSHYSKYT
jgi:hypothetical protein